MKTLEDLGYEKAGERKGIIIYERKDLRDMHILVDKTRKLAWRDCDIDGSCIPAWLTIDEMKAIMALLEETK